MRALVLAVALLIPTAAWAQDTGGVEDEQGEEIVVRATFGRTTMLFDKGNDGKLRNCRIMVSSGSQKRDTDACKATPVCYAATADQVTDCVELTALAPEAIGAPAPPPASEGGVQTFTMPTLVKPQTPSTVTVGPVDKDAANRETERQRVVLPPLPKPPTDGPVIRLSNGQDQ